MGNQSLGVWDKYTLLIVDGDEHGKWIRNMGAHIVDWFIEVIEFIKSIDFPLARL